MSLMAGGGPVDLTAILRSVYADSLDGILISDPQTNIIDVNEAYCTLTGYARAELIGQKTNVIRAGVTPKETFVQMWGDLNSKGRWVGELINRRKEGELWWSYISITKIVDSLGNPAAYVGIARDITERKHMEEQLREIDRLKSEFIATVSHELRTPMTAIKGALGLALGGAAGPLIAEMRELLTIAHNNSDRLILLINDILDLSRIEAGKLSLRLAPIDIIAVVRRSVLELAPLAGQKAIDVVLELADPLPVAIADADRVGQVLVNLLSNAIKFSDPGKRVSVRVARHERGLAVRVIDRGVGIPADYQAHIFDRFYRVDNSASRRTGGTGLGLAICRALVTEMGGRIWVESEPGVGSTFSFSLPTER
jgi:PAS domain S-box-containing protein